jgi:RNA exonuclease 4
VPVRTDNVSCTPRPGKYIALDCEFVGVGPGGTESALARVSIVDFNGRVVLDTFVKTAERVVDYRTWVSGVREKDLTDGVSPSDPMMLCH